MLVWQEVELLSAGPGQAAEERQEEHKRAKVKNECTRQLGSLCYGVRGGNQSSCMLAPQLAEHAKIEQIPVNKHQRYNDGYDQTLKSFLDILLHSGGLGSEQRRKDESSDAAICWLRAAE